MGFHFTETMAGTYRDRKTGERRGVSFTVIARARDWLRHLFSHKAALDGRVTVEGVATDRPLAGELHLDPVIGRVIRYQFTFPTDEGKTYRFFGEKHIDWLRAKESWTSLGGEIIDEHGKVVAEAELQFDLATLARFVASFRPWY